MARMAALGLWLAASGALAAQVTVLPAEQARIIDRTSAIAVAWAAGLPDFLCTQTIRRSEIRKNGKAKRLDVLTLELDSVAGKEHRKLIAVNNHPTRATYESLNGVLSSGEFGSTLSEVFRPGAAQFRWDRQEILRSRTVDVFGYEIAASKSEFQMEWRVSRTQSRKITVANRGYVFIDRDSGQVLRLIQTAYDIPPDCPVRQTGVTMDFDYSDIGGRRYLLAARAELSTEDRETRFVNEEEFRDYRKFSADTSVSFEDSADRKP